MQKLLFTLLLAVTAIAPASAFDLKDLGSMISNVTASNKFNLSDLNGSWAYTSPAVAFASDNALQKIGGAAAATAVEAKLAPYYQTAGLTSVAFTFADATDGSGATTFTMKLKVGTLKGTVEQTDDGMLAFKFSAFGKIPLGSVSAMATKSGSTLNLTFDVSGLINILTQVNKVTKQQSLDAILTLLSSYDGIYAGFKLSKQK